MKRHNIQYFASESDQKAAVVKRFNRTKNPHLDNFVKPRTRLLGWRHPEYCERVQPFVP